MGDGVGVLLLLWLLLLVVVEQDEKMELLEKLKQASKAPEQAAMRVCYEMAC